MNQVTVDDIKNLAMAANGSINKVYLHWSAGHYGQFFADYHFNIDADGSIYTDCTDLTEHKNHTYMRNTGAVALALAACAGADTNDLGAEPPTQEQIEAMAQAVAVLCKYLGLTADIQYVMTHAEAANNLDGENPGYEANGYPDGKYGPGYSCERWDLWFLQNGDAPWSGGDTLREKANNYINSGQLP